MVSRGVMPTWAIIALGSFVPAITWGPAYYLRTLYQREKSWPQVPVRILESKVVTEIRSRNRTYFDVRIRFSYFYGGLALESQAVYNGGRTYYSRSDAQEHANRQAAGTQVMASVNPEKPTEAVLEISHSTFLEVALFITGLLWALFFASPLWLPLVKKSRG